MKRRVALKIVELVVTLVTITFLSFLLVYLAPSDAAEKMLNGHGFVASQDVVDALRTQLGLDQSVIAQYISWMSHVVQGDFGTSFRTGMSVTSMLAPALMRTVQLAAMAFGITVVVSLPVGALCARRANGKLDRAVRYVTYVLASLPSYFAGLLLLYLFAVVLKVIPVQAVSSSNPLTLLVPAVVLSLNLTAWMIRQVRTTVLERMGDDFAVGLRAAGVPEKTVFSRYIVKSSLVPVVTALGICLGSILGGAILVENVFSWPGLGMAVMTAIDYLDYPVIQGFTVWIALIYFAINVLIDVLCSVVDPRVRATGGARMGGSRLWGGVGRGSSPDAEASIEEGRGLA